MFSAVDWELISKVGGELVDYIRYAFPLTFMEAQVNYFCSFAFCFVIPVFFFVLYLVFYFRYISLYLGVVCYLYFADWSIKYVVISGIVLLPLLFLRNKNRFEIRGLFADLFWSRLREFGK